MSEGTDIPTQGATILLVDDEETILKVGTEILQRLGHTVLQARDGEEALEIYRREKDHISLVILDMVMPKVNGGAAYDRLKEINPEVVVLLSSGYSIDGEVKDILDRGCNGFIQKPFRLADLVSSIESVLKT